MEVWMILMTTLFFFGASFGQSPDPNEFSVTTYDAINSELQKCAIPSAKMFDKSIAGQDRVLAYSTFDWFCYYEALQKNNQVALFMCKYYRFLVKTYYDDFCKSDSPAKKPLDKSVQYADFVSNPDAVCNYLQQNLQTADQQKVFKSPDECTLLCANAYAEFCENFGFILNIANNNTNPEETNNDAAGTPEGNNEDNTNPEETNNDAAGTPEEINEVPLKAEGYGNPPPADDQDDNTGEPGDGVDEAEENPGDVQIDDNDGEDVNGTNDGQDWDAPAQQGEGYDWDENEEGNNEDTFNLNQNQNDGNQDLFQDDSESTYDSADSADSEANQQPNEETKETSGHAGADEQIEADRNLLIEEERKFLEQESSSHFLAYSLTAIILVMVTYILYHNKQKIVAIIIEGRHGGQGKRRRYNQNVSEAMPTLKSAKLAV